MLLLQFSLFLIGLGYAMLALLAIGVSVIVIWEKFKKKNKK